MKTILLILSILFGLQISYAQGVIKILSTTHINSKSNAFIVLKNMNLVNEGNVVQAVNSGTLKITGSANTTFSGSGISTIDKLEIAIDNNNTHSLSSLMSVRSVVTVNSGQLVSGGNLKLKSDSATNARIAAIVSTAVPPIAGNVTVEHYVRGRRKYRLICSEVTTSANATLTVGQEGLSIWGNWQNQGNNTTANVGTLITGGSSADGFDTQTANASLFTYDDVNRQYIGYTSANGKNTKYTPLKAGVAFLMFVYGDRLNTIFATNPHNTSLTATGTVKCGDQVYNTGSGIPLSGVTGRFTLLGNPFVSAVNWASIPRTNIENTYWGWDPSLNNLGGYITVNTSGTVTLQAPYTGNTGLNQYIQPGQGFFVRTSGASPAMTIREQDKVADFNGNRFGLTTNNVSLMAINLQYMSNGSKILADGVLTAFDNSYNNSIGPEDAVKIANAGESVCILNAAAALSIDARKLPQSSDTVFLNIARLTKPQYTLQIFAGQMENSGVVAFLEDNYLNTLQPLLLNDTNNIVFNVNTAVPASADANRFRIVFNSMIVILPLKFISIKASEKNKDVLVEWQVAVENETLRYEIDRSADGMNFTKAGMLTARGSSGNETYQWLDTDPLNGYNYYRIRAIQQSGGALQSKIVNIKIKSALPAITVFPNPVVNKELHLRCSMLEKGMYNLLIYNQQGQTVLKREIEQTGTALDLNIPLDKTLPTGIYYLQLVNGNAKYGQKIFIE